MSTPFNPIQGLVIVAVNVYGPQGSGAAHLALDTGATETTISRSVLQAVGIDAMQMNTGFVRVVTDSGIISVPLVRLDRLDALGQQQTGFTVQAHTLPGSLPIDGVLGLDFIRGYRLVVDFRTGYVVLA